jgi:hypothetical protein
MKKSGSLVLSIGLSCLAAALPAHRAHADATNPASRILLLSIDGMHALDLARFARTNPSSTLSMLLRNAVNYTTASGAKPADSFPGMMAIATGGSPISTGVYFDLSYDRLLWPPGVTNGPTGTMVAYNETIDFNPNVVDGGGGLNPALMPRDPARGGAVVYPHNYLRVNTIFEVIKAAGHRTAWSDKHLADEMVHGPSGQGVDDLFLLEINGVNACAGCNVGTTKSLDATKAFDDTKVQGILNQINGFDHTGTTNVGVPTIFGMNFQAVSVAQRLQKNRTITGTTITSGPNAGPGGYLDGSGTPSLLLSSALAHTSSGLFNSTYIIVTAKHGQAPIDITKFIEVDPILVSNLVESVSHPVQVSGDDAMLIWLQNQSNTTPVVSALLNNQTNLSFQDIWGNDLLKLHFPDPTLDPRTPDIIAIGKPGTIYATSSKIAEHGGFSDQDVNVPILISNPSLPPQTIKTPVTTAQLAPTILQLLGLNPFALQAVQMEKTPVLPGFEAVQACLNPPYTPATLSSTIARTNGQAQFQVTAANLQRFVIQASPDLTNWVSIGTNIMAVGGSLTVTDSQAASSSNRFYRAVETP